MHEETKEASVGNIKHLFSSGQSDAQRERVEFIKNLVAKDRRKTGGEGAIFSREASENYCTTRRNCVTLQNAPCRVEDTDEGGSNFFSQVTAKDTERVAWDGEKITTPIGKAKFDKDGNLDISEASVPERYNAAVQILLNNYPYLLQRNQVNCAELTQFSMSLTLGIIHRFGKGRILLHP